MLPLPAQLFAPELADVKNLKLHVVGAVYGAKLAWSMAHDGQEPPARVVRSPKACAHMVDKLLIKQAKSPRVATCVLEFLSNIVYDLRVAPREGPPPF